MYIYIYMYVCIRMYNIYIYMPIYIYLSLSLSRSLSLSGHSVRPRQDRCPHRAVPLRAPAAKRAKRTWSLGFGVWVKEGLRWTCRGSSKLPKSWFYRLCHQQARCCQVATRGEGRIEKDGTLMCLSERGMSVVVQLKGISHPKSSDESGSGDRSVVGFTSPTACHEP